ncbi:MAG: leucyl/phenylalanyl-tRNA--protein transferase [Gammaproteobacteria bacterium]|nr:MAG: leucyl/phenylalanyl-tRNA--protein transferase [Gammaproteobacteria bacterium]
MPIPFLLADDRKTPFPAPRTALREPNGLLMAGANLAPERLLAAYHSGIFPWYEAGDPILWWSPDPRCVIWPKKIRIRRSLAKVLRRGDFDVTFDLAFREVIRNCGGPRRGSKGTWITDEMIEAYCRLHELGYAHSLEVWKAHEFVGGLYGIGIGRVFIGESMFSRVSDASKVALVALAQCGDYDLIDCQLETDHLLSMGAESIGRQHYLEALQELGGSSENPAVRMLESAR